MTMRVSITILGAVLTTACMPMEQAPLVYSSKEQMGVGVAAGTPDSPGLDINIGYKGLDVAFVPVAFAKRCDPKAVADCPAANYNIQQVLGLNTTRGLSESKTRELNKVKRQLEDNADLQNQLADQSKAKQDQLTAIRSAATDAPLVQALTTVDATTGQAPALTPDQVVQLRDANARLALVDGRDEATVQAEVDDLKRKQGIAETEAARLGRVEEDLLAQRLQSNNDDKKDALSVYGSFGGDANGDKNGAGLTLGKVFSTGVAAQNVSQGIRNASKLTAAGECLTKARLLIGPAPSERVLVAALTACKPPVDYGETPGR